MSENLYREVRFDGQWLVVRWYPESIGCNEGAFVSKGEFVCVDEFEALGAFVGGPK